MMMLGGGDFKQQSRGDHDECLESPSLNFEGRLECQHRQLDVQAVSSMQ
jgi:hypothetical protein